jgi:hypothetical protein
MSREKPSETQTRVFERMNNKQEWRLVNRDLTPDEIITYGSHKADASDGVK